MNLWTHQRRVARIRMLRYVGYKRHCTAQLKLRTRNVIKRRLGRSYTLLMTPSFKQARTAGKATP